MKKSLRLKDVISPKAVFFSIIGSFVYVLGFLFFIKPISLYSGGFLGVAQLISLLFPTSLTSVFDVQGVLYFIFNIPLMILGLRSLGLKFMSSSIITIIAESVMLSVIPSPATPIVDDMVVCCVLGGCIEGIGTVITLNAFSSTGGTDILGLLLSKKTDKISAGRMSLYINLVIYAISAFLFSIQVAIFSFIASLVSSFVMDRFHIQNKFLVVNIISTKEAEIIQFITETLRRDATIAEATGAYAKGKKTMIISVMSEYDYSRFQREIKSIDPESFVFVQPNVKILGNFEKRFSDN